MQRWYRDEKVMGDMWRTVGSSRKQPLLVWGGCVLTYASFWPLFGTEESKKPQVRLWDEVMGELAPVVDFVEVCWGS